MAQKNKYLTEPVWVRESRIVAIDSNGVKRWEHRWTMHLNLLQACVAFYDYNRSQFEGWNTHYEFWLSGCEQIEQAVLTQYHNWVKNLREERRRERHAYRYPGFRGSKPRGGHWLRSPRTTRSCKQALNIERGFEQQEPKCRAKQNHTNLPNAWDDRPVSCREDRSWKRFRAQQYKKAQPSFRKQNWDEPGLTNEGSCL